MPQHQWHWNQWDPAVAHPTGTRLQCRWVGVAGDRIPPEYPLIVSLQAQAMAKPCPEGKFYKWSIQECGLPLVKPD